MLFLCLLNTSLRWHPVPFVMCSQTNLSTKGRGTHTWPDGRKVAGQWKDGHLDGKLR